jgi:hypothetical protein
MFLIHESKVARWPHGCRRRCSEVVVPALVGSNLTEGGGFFPRKEPPPGHGCVCMSSGAYDRVVEGRATLFHTKARSAGFKKVPRSPVAHKGKKERKKQAERKVPDRPVRFKGERQLKKKCF